MCDPIEELRLSSAYKRPEAENRQPRCFNQVIDAAAFPPVSKEELSDRLGPLKDVVGKAYLHPVFIFGLALSGRLAMSRRGLTVHTWPFLVIISNNPYIAEQIGIDKYFLMIVRKITEWRSQWR